MMSLPAATLRWAAAALGKEATIRGVRQLPGATSSTLYALEIERAGRIFPCVLRLYDNPLWLTEEPDVPVREAAVLGKAFRAGLVAPEAIALDPTGTQAGGIPALLMTKLPGRVVLIPDALDQWLHALASALLPLHALPADELPWQYAPYAEAACLTPPLWSRIPHLWKRVIELAQEPPPAAPSCFIHRDYHPNNVLWQGETISGIVDWPNGCRGVAQADIAWCRRNLIYLHGISAADRFLSAYEDLAGAAFAYHPYWDILALIEELPGPPTLYPPWAEFGIQNLTEAIMRERLDNYLESVLRGL